MEKLVIVGMIIILMFTMCAMVAHAEVYPNAGNITKIDEELDLIYVTTLFDGNELIFEGIEDFSVGDVVAMIMDDVGTEWIVDDVIVTVRYLGWVA